MSRVTRSLSVCLIVAVFAGTALADDLADIEKQLIEAQKKLKSFSAKLKTSHDMDLGEGNTLKADSKGTLEWMQKGDTVMYRMETAGERIQNIGGREDKAAMASTNVCDGKYLYVLSDVYGNVSAAKYMADQKPRREVSVEETLKSLRKSYDLKRLPDEELQGCDCFVLQATPKNADRSPTVKDLHYFCKDLGMVIKSAGYDKGGKAIFTWELTDIRKDTGINPDRFRFEAPEGVEVQDMTGK
jgi:outer membrane lipoprotein-sorting protein